MSRQSSTGPKLVLAHACAFALVGASLALAASAVAAAEVPWKKQKFNYVAQGKPVRDLLREFGASQGLSMVVSKDVEGVVNGKFDLMPESLMALMSANFGFVWYYDGSVVHVTPASDVRTQVVRLGGTPTERLRAALARLDIPDARYPITYDPKQGTALVSGPSRYVELVMQTARAIGQNQSDKSEVRLVPLRYAWAADFTYTQNGEDRTLPGVATVMSRLYAAEASPSVTHVSTRGRSTLDKLRGLGLAGTVGGSMRGRADAEEADREGDAPLSTGGLSAPGMPQFIADGRLNAVLVRDAPERLAVHEAAIRALDVKPGLVEIEARIIEVNTEEAESLGLDWRARGSRFDLQFGQPGALPTLGWGSAQSPQAPAVGPLGPVPLPVPAPAGVATTVLGDAGRYLIARVSALAQQGKANLLSSPKVMTLDNVEAALENMSTFFVRVQGNLDVDLFNVSSGSSLRVTPLILSENGQTQVKLAIRIEDGVLTGQTVDGIPVVRRNTITTQSIIGDGQALLIGGYSQEVGSSDSTGVPGLSTIPALGWLFKSESKRKTKVERFFLLTPRVVVPQ